MNQSNSNRRNFLKNTSMLSGAYLLSGLQNKVTSQTIAPAHTNPIMPNRIKFAVINIDHPHIYGMTDANYKTIYKILKKKYHDLLL